MYRNRHKCGGYFENPCLGGIYPTPMPTSLTIETRSKPGSDMNLLVQTVARRSRVIPMFDAVLSGIVDPNGILPGEFARLQTEHGQPEAAKAPCLSHRERWEAIVQSAHQTCTAHTFMQTITPSSRAKHRDLFPSSYLPPARKIELHRLAGQPSRLS
ncbi:uncharacterized protein MCYG_07818 [Microsporum canis CBS 113480]|uniref:Uncharacterized protein n=1 Tax=Arthroderma otae (strain ATCC MYA-4605 / CBS 113480) TaxID=554155 RepID=C5FXF9_ARTOC|nr:uncharacterized protein MCYG_07818 [Microsporum canis CBS 113480]EEQ34999.1 predicted protein [Microsporum canis CBS 113480]